MTLVYLPGNILDVSDGQAPSTRPVLRSEGFWVVACVLLMPILFYVASIAPYQRFLYPVCNLALAAHLFKRRSPWYVAHTLLLFCFVSLARRLVDAQAGWDAQNPILLTPYLCGLLSVVDLLNYWMQRQPRFLGPFLVILASILYGVGLAFTFGRVAAALVDLLKWGFGPIFAIHILSRTAEQAQMRRVVEGCLVWAGTAMAIYGVAQFVNPTSWDTLWAYGVIDSGMASLGYPAPFQLRTFSTMNSPGSFGAIMCCGIIVALKRKMPVAIPTIALMCTGLALCQYRAVWAATVFAAILVIAGRPQLLRPSNILATAIVALAMCSAILMPGIHDAVLQRAASLNNIGSDTSFEDRLSQYERLARADDLISGIGLGINGSARKLDDLPRQVIDGGIIEIALGLGVLVGTVYLGALAVLIAHLFRRNRRAGNDLNYDRALVAATFIQLPMGSVQIGEIGFCAWMYIGFGLAALSMAHRAACFERPVSGTPGGANIAGSSS
jgi:hypothetical protein